VAKFKYLGMTLTNQSLIHEEIKSRVKSGKAWYHSVQDLLFSCLLFKNIKLKIHRNIILSAVVYGCKTCTLTKEEEHRLRKLVNRVYGHREDEVTGK
jgi:hypothetical protein